MKRNVSMKKKPKNYLYNLIGKFKYFIFTAVCIIVLAIYYIFFKFKEGKITLDDYKKLAGDATVAENTAELNPLFTSPAYDVNRKIANDSRLNEMRSFIIKQPGIETVVVTASVSEDQKTKAIKSVKSKELMIKIVDAIILGDRSAKAIKISDYSWSIQEAMKFEIFDHTIEIAYDDIPNRIPQPKNDRFTDEYYLFYKQPRTILSYLLYPSLDYNNDGIDKTDQPIEYIKFDLKGGPLAYFEKEINTLLDLVYNFKGKIDIFLNKRTPFNGESPFYTFVKFASNPLGKYGTFDSLIDKDKYDITTNNITYNETSYSPSSPAPAAFPLINGPGNAGLQLLIKLIKKFGKWHGTDDFGDSKRILDISVPVWLINIGDPDLNALKLTENRPNNQHGDLWWGMIEVWPYHNFYEIIINLLFDFTNWKMKDSNGKIVTDYINESNEWTTFTPASKNNTSVIYLRDKIKTIMKTNPNWPLSGTPGV